MPPSGNIPAPPTPHEEPATMPADGTRQDAPPDAPPNAPPNAPPDALSPLRQELIGMGAAVSDSSRFQFWNRCSTTGTRQLLSFAL
jgi:hypothetical protein